MSPCWYWLWDLSHQARWGWINSQWWGPLGFPSMCFRPSTPCLFQRLCLNWVQYHWLGLIFLNYNYSLVLFLENYTLVPLIGVLNIPNLFSHTFTVSGFLSTDGWTHALCMGFTGGVSEGKSILECLLGPMVTPMFYTHVWFCLSLEWGCLLSSQETDLWSTIRVSVRESGCVFIFFPKFLNREGTEVLKLDQNSQKHKNSASKLEKLKLWFSVFCSSAKSSCFWAISNRETHGTLGNSSTGEGTQSQHPSPLCGYVNSTLLGYMLNCFSRVQLSVTPWSAAHQAPLSMGFSRQEHWSGLPCPLQVDPGCLMSPMSPVLAHGFFTTSTTWEALA